MRGIKVGQEFRALLAGEKLVSDAQFDRIYSEWAQRRSARHWTPVSIAVAAAKLLVAGGKARILDVGSGVGKLCHIGASVTAGTFFGVEQRMPLVEEATRVGRELEIERAHFSRGNALDLDWSTFDGIYLFNPFYEHLEPSCRLDDTIPPNSVAFHGYVADVYAKLRAMPLGARLVTYHGYGGPIPTGWQGFFSCRHDGDYLRAWVKVDDPFPISSNVA